jgi:high-affinity nickel permease
VIAVFGLDDRIAELGAGGGIAVAFLVALLLGLRHSTDPDHLTAVSTLCSASAEAAGARPLRWACPGGSATP